LSGEQLQLKPFEPDYLYLRQIYKNFEKIDINDFAKDFSGKIEAKDLLNFSKDNNGEITLF
jgi:hypothetical protein